MDPSSIINRVILWMEARKEKDGEYSEGARPTIEKIVSVTTCISRFVGFSITHVNVTIAQFICSPETVYATRSFWGACYHRAK